MISLEFIDWFAGVGGFRAGMEQAGHKCIGFCEFDTFAARSYIAIHLLTDDERLILSNLEIRAAQKYIDREIISRIEEREWYRNDVRTVNASDIPRADCWCFGFPCQDISVAGKQCGFNGHRSSLFFTVTKLIRDLEEKDRPSYLLIENVKNLLSVNRGLDFAKLLIELDEIGYDAEWQVINSADYVPQNRERVFIVGHFRGRSTSKVFPIEGADRKNNVLTININDSMGKERYQQDRVYYCSGILPSISAQLNGRNNIAMPAFCDLSFGAGLHITKGARCLQARYNKGIANRRGEVSGVAIPVLTPERAEKRQNGRRFKENGEPMFTLTSQDRHGVVVKVREATKKGYALAGVGDSVNLSMPNSKTRRGRVGKGIANTLDTQCNQGVLIVVEGGAIYAIWNEKYQCYIAIRRLTPKECFRLQGWHDVNFERAALVSSDSQLYKQAGNGVTVPVIRSIGEKMEIMEGGFYE
ncbi:DNA (cytosine-5-)-methyltransferase [Anaerotignum sp.]|uniref:DNA (cytosine-5-)-methyltransferase n=1 Tax=Anaerotignum sp. TaxID=2039241 RepID=UPI0028A9878A|nr:DNA (cytosine-5-)-methyltransferase [Anaerotignum sp.]